MIITYLLRLRYIKTRIPTTNIAQTGIEPDVIGENMNFIALMVAAIPKTNIGIAIANAIITKKTTGTKL
jgi:hypothetical protein